MFTQNSLQEDDTPPIPGNGGSDSDEESKQECREIKVLQKEIDTLEKELKLIHDTNRHLNDFLKKKIIALRI